MKNRSKILLTGDPGTGKTMTASVLADELGLPLYVIQIDRLVTKYMGETSVKLRQVYECAKGLSHADVVRACEEAIKYSLISDVDVGKAIILSYIQDRKSLYKYKEA